MRVFKADSSVKSIKINCMLILFKGCSLNEWGYLPKYNSLSPTIMEYFHEKKGTLRNMDIYQYISTMHTLPGSALSVKTKNALECVLMAYPPMYLALK